MDIKQQKLFSNENVEIDNICKIKKRVVFKTYNQNQEYLLPKNIEECISEGHICRLINTIIDKMDFSSIENHYKGGGTSAYHPRMLLKVWILGFINHSYSCRILAKQTRENLTFMWISGNQTPDFRTLNNFRKGIGKDIKIIFKEVVIQGISLGIISGKDIFIDHTKKEANANKHKVVWRKQVERQSKKIDDELDKLFEYIDEVNDNEDNILGNKDLPEQIRNGFDSEKIKEIVKKINEKIKNNSLEKDKGNDIKKKIRRSAELVNKKEEYRVKKEILNGRNSYSKTDISAVAMMMKDKISIKPGYNEGVAVENGFVINFILSDSCGDVVSFIPLMNGVIHNLGKTPETVTADGAYGNEETHSYMEQQGIGNYLKYNTYYRESKKNPKNKKFILSDFIYNSENDSFTCKQGNTLILSKEQDDIIKSGYVKKVKVYNISEDKCSVCPIKDKCTTGKSRSLTVSWEAERLKAIARENLNSEKGKELRSRRANEVESIFGDQKLNNKVRRYLLRGLEKVNIEAGLYYISHNIKKINQILKKKKNTDAQNKSKILKLMSSLNTFMYFC